VLNLPLVGLFVALLRIPYGYLYPAIAVFCVLGVYAVNQSVVDVWIMLVFGGLGYLLRKLGFDVAPIVLGLILAPILEMSARQALAMSAGSFMIFLDRRLAAGLFAATALLLILSLWSAAGAGRWRRNVGLDA
jgi:TctA family transporter